MFPPTPPLHGDPFVQRPAPQTIGMKQLSAQTSRFSLCFTSLHSGVQGACHTPRTERCASVVRPCGGDQRLCPLKLVRRHGSLSLSLASRSLSLPPAPDIEKSKGSPLPCTGTSCCISFSFRRLDWLEVRERSKTKTPSSDAPLQARHIFWRFVRHSYPIKPQTVLLSRQAEGGSRVSMEL